VPASGSTKRATIPAMHTAGDSLIRGSGTIGGDMRMTPSGMIHSGVDGVEQAIRTILPGGHGPSMAICPRHTMEVGTMVGMHGSRAGSVAPAAPLVPRGRTEESGEAATIPGNEVRAAAPH